MLRLKSPHPRSDRTTYSRIAQLIDFLAEDIFRWYRLGKYCMTGDGPKSRAARARERIEPMFDTQMEGQAAD